MGAALKAVSQLVADTHSSFSGSLVCLMDRSTCACIYFMISFLISPRYLEKFNNIKCDAKQCLTVPLSRCPDVPLSTGQQTAPWPGTCVYVISYVLVGKHTLSVCGGVHVCVCGCSLVSVSAWPNLFTLFASTGLPTHNFILKCLPNTRRASKNFSVPDIWR